MDFIKKNNNVYQTKHRQCGESSCITQHEHPIINRNGHVIEHHNKDQLDNRNYQSPMNHKLAHYRCPFIA